MCISSDATDAPGNGGGAADSSDAATAALAGAHAGPCVSSNARPTRFGEATSLRMSSACGNESAEAMLFLQRLCTRPVGANSAIGTTALATAAVTAALQGLTSS